jgi:hypothetical protein
MSAARREIKYASAKEWARRQSEYSRRAEVYCKPTRLVNEKARLTTLVSRRAEVVYAELERHHNPGPYKKKQKQEYLAHLIREGLRALWCGATIMQIRCQADASYCGYKNQVNDAMVRAGYFTEVRSPARSNHRSRLVPTAKLAELETLNPWTFDPASCPLVIVRERGGDKKGIPFDPKHPVARDTAAVLGKVNKVNAACKISYQPFNEGDESFLERRRLRPFHYAVFLNDLYTYGRIHTGKYGHQQLCKVERSTIRFADQASVELDYAGLHLRLLYHLEGIDYRKDPYALWGEDTTSALRLVVKRLANALINAGSEKAAVGSCNRAMSVYTEDGRTKKTGKALRHARALYRAVHESNKGFKDILPELLASHQDVRHQFGKDLGITLMRRDSQLALEVLRHFSDRGVPCLGCHDSFVVPQEYEAQLRTVMGDVYYRNVGFYPAVRG